MTLSKFTNVKITGSVCVVPERHIDIDDEIKFYKDEKIHINPINVRSNIILLQRLDMYCPRAALALTCVKKPPGS